MTLDDFSAMLQQTAPPATLPPALVALWHDARGNWDAAHRVAQDLDGEDGAWIHAYLHRKEGDSGNAAYWYRRAGRPVASGSLASEWRTLAAELLERLS
jgi:hypothetical protein